MTNANRPPELGYAARVDAVTMSPRRRMLRWGRTWSAVWLAGIWWVGLAVLFSQLLFRGPVTGVLAAIVAVGLAIGTAACLRALRANQARRVVAYVEQAVRLALPMPEFLRAAALAERRKVRVALLRLADSLSASARLGDALRNAVPELPLRAAGVVRVADDNGTLPAALARLVAEHEPSPQEAVRRRFPWLYLAILAAIIPLICAILAIFVLPKFAEVFRDFGAPRPAWMGPGRGVDSALFGLAFLLMLLGVVVLLTLLARSFRWILFGRRDIERPLVELTDRLAWALPIVGGLIRDRGHADVCQAVADGLAAYRPADVAVGEAALLDLNAVLAERVRVWRSGLAAGQSLGRAARLAGMPRLVADLAPDAGDPTHAADAFAFLARHYRGRAERTHEWLVAIATPAITVVAGLCVGAIAYALFDAFQRLISYSLPKNLGL